MRKTYVLLAIGALFIISCEGKEPRKIGEFCLDESDCESGLCYDSQCLNPDDDHDHDGLKNGVEKNVTGTDYGLADTDGDNVDDGVEVGPAPTAPIDTDGDGIIDALESALLTADPDKDCIPDQFDPENDVFSEDAAKIAELNCTHKGVCGDGFDKVTATCSAGSAVCDYSAVTNYEATEVTCDNRDNDCDGTTDQNLTAPDEPECRSLGVCAGHESAIFRMCRGGVWECEYSAIDQFENVESSCDGLDNNCDGDTDEGLVDQECFNRNEYGKCPGITACNDTEGVKCVGDIPAAEICNEIDDDCDGETDEELIGIACSRINIFGTCEGVTVCDMATGGTECDAREPAAEMCDGIDNDCNGATDEEFICERTSTVSLTVYGATIQTIAFKAGEEPAYEPLAGATVKFFKDACPEEVSSYPAWMGTTDETGSLVMPVQPGTWCIGVSRDGYQEMRSYTIYIPSGVVIPIDLVLLLNGMTGTQLSFCGRVVEPPDYVLEGSGSTDVPATGETPIPNALVTLTDATAGTDVASTMSDEYGYWCMTGLPTLQAGHNMILTGIRDGWYPSSQTVTLELNRLGFTVIYLKPMATEPTTCLNEGFEGTAMANGWTIGSGSSTTVTWHEMKSLVCVAQAYTSECFQVQADESDASLPDTLLCPGETTFANGCIPAPGSLPSAYAGNGFAWFGNVATCGYSDPVEGCSPLDVRVSGTLESPWLNGMDAWTLAMTFKSAWEVESSDPAVDIMYIEAQTSPQSETGSWTIVGILNSMVPDETVLTSRAAVGGPSTSGGAGSGPAWKTYSIDLAPFAGEWFRVRFRFDSIDGNTNFFRGWLIDEVNVSGLGCGEPAAI